MTHTAVSFTNLTGMAASRQDNCMGFLQFAGS